MHGVGNPGGLLLDALDNMSRALEILDRHDESLVAAQLSTAIDTLKARVPQELYEG